VPWRRRSDGEWIDQFEMNALLDDNSLVLMEAAIVERLRRTGETELHPSLVHAPLIYDGRGRAALTRLYQSYMDIANRADLPILLCSPTWRANRDRIEEYPDMIDLNGDALQFMKELRAGRSSSSAMVKIGGLIGCRNDCYKPDQGLPSAEAESFHAWQLNRLAEAGVDFLMAATLPCVEEAVGIARAMEKTEAPYIISFVIDRKGRVLDGSSLINAMGTIDEATTRSPIGYMVNCAHPTFLRAAEQPKELFERLIGYQANASSLDHGALDGSDRLEAGDVAEWGEEMIGLNRDYGVIILGGCCGTGEEHLDYLIRHCRMNMHNEE